MKVNLTGAVLVIAILVVLPLVFPGRYQLDLFTAGLLYGMFAASWDFMSGLTGRESFGHTLFIGVGAYFAGFWTTVYYGDPAAALVLCTLCAGVAALLIGIPTLRLRGPYFALATLASAIVMQRLAIGLWQYTGGEEGLHFITPLVRDRLTFYYIVLAVVVVSTAVLLLLAHSRIGKIARAIRGDEAACQASGINTTRYKILMLLISGMIAGLAGGLYAEYQQAVNPSIFGLPFMISIMTMAYVGGMGSIYGSVIAAFLLTILVESLRPFGEWRLLLHAMTLIMVIFFFRDGLVQPVWEKLAAKITARRTVASPFLSGKTKVR